MHAEIGIVDDRWLTVRSANLDEHSLFDDTEANLVVDDPEPATTTTTTRRRLWASTSSLSSTGSRVILRSCSTTSGPDGLGAAGAAPSRRPAHARLVERPGIPRRARRLLGLIVDGEAEHAVGRGVVPSAERARRRRRGSG